MGVWGSIAKGIVGAIPIVGPIIQGGIEAATAKKAADQQVQGGQRAMDIQNQVYTQQQALMQPYYNTGTTAFTTLGGLLGLPQGSPAGTGPVSSAPTGPQPNTPWGGTVLDSMQNSGAITNPANAPDATYGANNQWIGGQTTQQQRAAMPTASSYNSAQTYGSSPQAGGGLVQVRAPNGSVYSVPAEKVSEAQQNGGTVLGRG